MAMVHEVNRQQRMQNEQLKMQNMSMEHRNDSDNINCKTVISKQNKTTFSAWHQSTLYACPVICYSPATSEWRFFTGVAKNDPQEHMNKTVCREKLAVSRTIEA